MQRGAARVRKSEPQDSQWRTVCDWLEGVARHDESFRYVESLYDLSSRAGLDLFGVARLHDEDPMKEFLRLFPSHKLLPFNANASVKEAEGIAFLNVVLQALGADGSLARPTGEAPGSMSNLLTRSAMCASTRPC